ncbi:MAG: putative NADPH-dependent reductase [Acidimicrobiales bacterium]|nr:putative NADPH-dependent reductase [Acidimicrobiales bacterium]
MPSQPAGAEVVTRVLLVSGSTRTGSTNTAALLTIRRMTPDGVEARLFERLAELPAFNPDDDLERLPTAVAELRGLIAWSDAMLFCTPEYAGALPGAFKNLLDWTVGGGEIYAKPVAWVNVAPDGRGANADASLATVLGYVGAAVIEPATVHIPVPRNAIGPDGLVSDPDLRARLATVTHLIVEHIRSGTPPAAPGPPA